MPIALRADFDAAMVGAAAKRSKNGPRARRLFASAAIYEGPSRRRGQATNVVRAEIGGVTVQIVRDWVLKFNAHRPAHSIRRRNSAYRS